MLMGVLVSPALGSYYTERASVSTSGEQADKPCLRPSISDDGRFVAFISVSGNLVAADTNGAPDVFVRDCLLGTTERVSLSATGEEANTPPLPPDPVGGHFAPFAPVISGSGRFAAFASNATNLVPGDTNGHWDVFVRDRELGTTERVSVSSTGEQGNEDSNSGISITPDGRFVAFSSSASSLVPGDTNGETDIFVRDRLLATTERASVTTAGEQADDYSHSPTISADGRFVAFGCWARNFPGPGLFYSGQVYVRDRLLGTTEAVSVSFDGWPPSSDSGGPSISADGRFVAFLSGASNLVLADTNHAPDVFVRDRLTATTELVSVTSSGEQADGQSSAPSISGDGRFVLFGSDARNLVSDDTNLVEDIFLRDRLTGLTLRVNLTSTDEQAETAHSGLSSAGNNPPALSRGGHSAAFCSVATNLVPGDTNRVADVFVRQICVSTFADVPCYHVAWEAVEAIAEAGITRGCAADRFCPADPVTRAQMALFLARAIGGLEGYTPAGCGQERFADVPCDYLNPGLAPSEFYRGIEYITDPQHNSIGRAVSRGCDDGDLFCPERTVTRGEMALFLARAIGGLDTYVPARCGRERFRDVKCNYPGGLVLGTEAYRAIEYIADGEHNAIGVALTRGCGDGTIYCPTRPCTRAEMAVFLARAFLGMD